MRRDGILRSLAAALTPLALCSCLSWQQPDPATVTPASISPASPIRLTLATGSIVVLEKPRLVGDSLIGEVGTRSERTAIALSDVKNLEVRGVSAASTAGGIAAGVLLFFTIGIVVTIALFVKAFKT